MGKYKGMTPARAKASEKYLTEKVDSITVRLPKGEKEKVQAAADAAGKSLSRFCSDAIREKAAAVCDSHTAAP